MQTRKIALLVGIILVGLAAFIELGTRLAFQQDAIVGRLIRDYDQISWQLSWINRHQLGIEVQFAFDRFDPTKGWSSFPKIRDLPVFEDKVLNTNRFGHRGNLDLTRAKRPGWKRIIVLGDSFTFGDEVSDDETYSYYLGQALADRQIEVVNLGVHGYGHDQMLILLKELGVSLAPDLVIVGYISVDITRNGMAFRDYAKPQFEWDGSALRLLNSPLPTPKEFIASTRWQSRLGYLLRMAWARIDNAMGWREERDEALTGHLLDAIAQVSADAGAESLIVFMPMGHQLLYPAAVLARERFLLDHCDSNPALHCGSVLMDFVSQLAEGQKFRGGGHHWTPQGHRVVAKGLQTLIEELDLLE